MRIMAIDYGDTRTGLAVSDRSGTLAGEAWTFIERNPEVLAKTVMQAARERQVERIVLGLPRNMDGSEGPRAEKSRAFAAFLEAEGAPEVILWDERRTTVSADAILMRTGKRGKKKKKVLDAVAASLILEGYLASLRNITPPSEI